MLLLLIIFVPAYLGIVWTATLLCRDPARRRRNRTAANIALGMAAIVSLVGVPYTRDSLGKPALVAVISVLVTVPLLLPNLARRARLGLLIAISLPFAVPILRVEYLTLRHADQLQAVYDARSTPAPRHQRLFSVFDYHDEHATVLRVEGKRTMGYFVCFRRESDGWTWQSPQAVLWSDAGNMRGRCPYPTAALLLLHGVHAVDC